MALGRTAEVPALPVPDDSIRLLFRSARQLGQWSREVQRMPDDEPRLAQACLRFGVVLGAAGA